MSIDRGQAAEKGAGEPILFLHSPLADVSSAPQIFLLHLFFYRCCCRRLCHGRFGTRTCVVFGLYICMCARGERESVCTRAKCCAQPWLRSQALGDTAWKELCAKLGQKYGAGAWAAVKKHDEPEPEPEPGRSAASGGCGDGLGAGGTQEVVETTSTAVMTNADKRRKSQLDTLAKFYAKHEPTKGRVRRDFIIFNRVCFPVSFLLPRTLHCVCFLVLFIVSVWYQRFE